MKTINKVRLALGVFQLGIAVYIAYRIDFEGAKGAIMVLALGLLAASNLMQALDELIPVRIEDNKEE